MCNEHLFVELQAITNTIDLYVSQLQLLLKQREEIEKEIDNEN
jgi:hypothetical protein